MTPSDTASATDAAMPRPRSGLSLGRVIFTFGPLVLCVGIWAGTTQPGIEEGYHRFLFFGRWGVAAVMGNIFATYLTVWCIAAVWSRRRRLVWQRFALMTGSTVLTLGALELPAYAGLVDYREIIRLPEQVLFTQQKPWDNPINRKDPELLHLHRPYYEFRGSTPGDLVYLLGIPTDHLYEVESRYDHNGFRNATDLEQADVVLIGDSFLEAGLVPFPSTLGPLLERRFGRPVANLGQAGYGPQQERITLKRFGIPLRPRVVVWFFFEGNDLLDVWRYQNTRDNWEQHLRAGRSKRRRSFLNNFLTTVAYMTQPTTDADAGLALRRSGTLTTGDTVERLYFAYPAAALSDQDLERLAVVQDEVTAARNLCEQNDASFVFVFLPTKFRVHGPRMEFPTNSDCHDWELNDLPTRLREFCDEAGIPFLDATPVLQERAETGELMYFPDDGHWNAAACEATAEALGPLLESCVEL